MVTIKFSTANAEFDVDVQSAAINVLQRIITAIEEDRCYGKVFDVNGNAIGLYDIYATEEEL